MTSLQIPTKGFGTVAVRDLAVVLDEGGEGRILETDNQSLLLKILDPRDDGGDLAALRTQKRKAYQTFANLRLGDMPELSCLPLEYVSVPSIEPAYIMKRAQGVKLKAVKNSAADGTPLIDRLQMALALATAMQRLHSAQIVHADVKWDNYFIHRVSDGYQVFVLDIDAGGYRGPTVTGRYERLTPTAEPTDYPFRAPELSGGWLGLWDTSWAFQPDLWALAVMIYCIVVDPEGPFPARKNRDLGTGMPQYVPYERTHFVTNPQWPKPWQAALLEQQAIPKNIVDGFISVFEGERNVVKSGKPRLNASDWAKRLKKAVADQQSTSLNVVVTPVSKPKPQATKVTTVAVPAPQLTAKQPAKPNRPIIHIPIASSTSTPTTVQQPQKIAPTKGASTAGQQQPPKVVVKSHTAIAKAPAQKKSRMLPVISVVIVILTLLVLTMTISGGETLALNGMPVEQIVIPQFDFGVFERIWNWFYENVSSILSGGVVVPESRILTRQDSPSFPGLRRE